MRKAILSFVDICLLPFGLLLPSETDTWREKAWAAIDVALTICYAGIIVLPLSVLGISLLVSSIKIKQNCHDAILVALMAVMPILIRNEVIDKHSGPDIMKVRGVVLGMKDLKTGLLGIGALGFLAGVALQNMETIIGSVLFACVAALVVFGPGDQTVIARLALRRRRAGPGVPGALSGLCRGDY